MSTQSAVPPWTEDFSLVLGGPLYEVYMRGRLLELPTDLVERRITVLIGPMYKHPIACELAWEV